MWRNVLNILIIVLLVEPMAGCSTLPSGRLWGEDVQLPTWERVKQIAIRSARNPETWVPAAGAAVFAMSGLDKPVSDWASRTNPIFGSQQAADNASDEINYLLSDAAAITTLATPGGDNPAEWLYAKTKGVAVHALARGLTGRVTISIKEKTGRERPDNSDSFSFPSGHTTQAYASATLTSRNLDSIQLSKKSRQNSQLGIKTMAAATAWARVEAKRHYPSDVLAGAALAHFLNLFIYDAFMGQQENSFIEVLERDDGALIRATWRY